MQRADEIRHSIKCCALATCILENSYIMVMGRIIVKPRKN